jgi:hypothetical protein
MMIFAAYLQGANFVFAFKLCKIFFSGVNYVRGSEEEKFEQMSSVPAKK